MIKDTDDKANDTWYLDFYALRYICNKRDFFSDIHMKNYEFITTRVKIIWS